MVTSVLTEPASDAAQRPGILAPEQWEALQALARSLTAPQALWASGFLLGLSGPAGLASAPAAAAGAAPGSTPGARRLTILYGSETGNSAALARTLAERTKVLGLQAVVVDMADYAPRRLKDEQDLLVITSTYGDGDPPQPAVGFFEFLDSRKAPNLAPTRYAVLALGDSSYEHFCAAGCRIDVRLEALGATRLHACVQCDVDFDAPAASWMDAVVDTLVSTQAQATGASVPRPAAAPVVDRKRPLDAVVAENLVLTGRGSTRETRHIELSFPEGALAFAPGDALGVVARNDPSLVTAFLDRVGLPADAPVRVQDRVTTLGDALVADFEITIATPRFIEEWAGVSDSAVLKRLTRPEHAAERSTFLRTHHAIDILGLYPVTGVAPDAVLRALRPLQPRLYSIASSQAFVPDEVHLTVSTVRYVLHELSRTGVASGHLADRCPHGVTLPVYVRANPHFRLPADDVPIVMIGAGTGVAPYRAFMQERDAREASGRSWLFFGDRHSRTDFLYQTEWQDLLKRQVLDRMDVAFSRDTTTRTYVQHRIIERARDVYAWMEEGAHVYVCGDATGLAPDVHEALATVIECAGGRDREGAEDYLRAMQQDRRYQRDVY